MRTLLTVPLILSLSITILGCAAEGNAGGASSGNFDASTYFPLEQGRYWIYFDPDSNFLTLELVGTTTVVGVEASVLRWTYDYDTTSGEEEETALEQYFVDDPELGVLLLGYKDFLNGESGNYVPGVVFAGKDMTVGEGVVTTTAESGQLASFTATLNGHGTVETYYGEFRDALSLSFGPTDGAQEKRFVADGYGLVKFDVDGVRYQLYDYGTR